MERLCAAPPARPLTLPLLARARALPTSPLPSLPLHTLSLPRFLLFFYSSYAPSPSLFSSRSLPVSFPFSFFSSFPYPSLLSLLLFFISPSSYLFPRPSSLPSLPLRPFILSLFISRLRSTSFVSSCFSLSSASPYFLSHRRREKEQRKRKGREL